MRLNRQLLWSRLDTTGIEHLRLEIGEQGIVADGLVIGLQDDLGFRLHYGIRCDLQWRVLRVDLDLISDQQKVSLTSDGHGRWFDHSGESLSTLAGCLDVDISATPFTNTLPIRRLPWSPGETNDIDVAYITIPGLQLVTDKQRYTCTDRNRFKFEQVATGFTAEIQVDPDGLVEDYPGLFKRVWSD